MSKCHPFCLGLNVFTRISPALLPVFQSIYQGDMSSFILKFALKRNQAVYKAFYRQLIQGTGTNLNKKTIFPVTRTEYKTAVKLGFPVLIRCILYCRGS